MILFKRDENEKKCGSNINFLGTNLSGNYALAVNCGDVETAMDANIQLII